MKENLRPLWSQKNKDHATAFLNDWIARAKGPNIKMLYKFADTLDHYSDGILAYYDCPISTAVPWKEPTIKSNLCRDRLMDFEIWPSLN